MSSARTTTNQNTNTILRQSLENEKHEHGASILVGVRAVIGLLEQALKLVLLRLLREQVSKSASQQASERVRSAKCGVGGGEGSARDGSRKCVCACMCACEGHALFDAF